jgi:molybdopterin-guanine dinucleotide biosynthesis protein A
MKRDDVTALILAGGKARRLGGVDKREIVVGGRTIFAHQSRRSRHWWPRSVIIAAGDDLRRSVTGVKIHVRRAPPRDACAHAIDARIGVFMPTPILYRCR